VSSRIREEFARFSTKFRPYARRKHRHSIFFSDQLLRTPLAFDLLNLVNERSLTNAMLGAHGNLQITISAKELQRDRSVPPKARMARSNQLMSATEVILAELSEIEKIIANESWFASERVGYPVDPHSPVIQARVAEIILSGTGEYLRNLVTATIPSL
jgi:hypothetical protein